jgi:hypothetical protein
MILIDEKNNSDFARRGVPLTRTIKIALGDFIIQRGKNWNALLKTFRIFFKFACLAKLKSYHDFRRHPLVFEGSRIVCPPYV